MTIAENIIHIAESQIGITESPRNSNNVKYNTWYYEHTVSGSAYPWCMTFVQWVCDKAGCKLPYKTPSCSGLLNWYKKNRPRDVLKAPEPGVIAIFNFNGSGHTGIVVKDNGDGNITTIEGNTSSTDAGSQSNGGGVFRRIRSKKNVTAYIRPFDILKEDDTMTGEEIYNKLNEYMNSLKMTREVEVEYNEAVAAGITDGTNPGGLTTRWQAAIMTLRGMQK